MGKILLGGDGGSKGRSTLCAMGEGSSIESISIQDHIN